MKASFLKSVLFSGIIAAVVFIILEVTLYPVIIGIPAFDALRMLAAVVMGKGVLPPPATFDLRIMMTEMLFHCTFINLHTNTFANYPKSFYGISSISACYIWIVAILYKFLWLYRSFSLIRKS